MFLPCSEQTVDLGDGLLSVFAISDPAFVPLQCDSVVLVFEAVPAVRGEFIYRTRGIIYLRRIIVDFVKIFVT